MHARITESFIRRVKDHLGKSWHDAAWHAFHARPDVEAVTYAIYAADVDDSTDDIIREAIAYLDALAARGIA
jgi:hypothetical protein